MTLLIIIAVPLDWLYPDHETRWSPYYVVDRAKESGDITVDTIGHQTMEAFETSGPAYSLIHSAIGL